MTRDEAELLSPIICPVIHRHTGRFELCGSYRRGKQVDIGDLDFLVADIDMSALRKDLEALEALPVVEILRQGEILFSYLAKFREENIQIEFTNVPAESFGSGLVHCTGGGKFNVGLRSVAKQKGFRLNQYGLTSIATEVLTPYDTEEGLFNALGFNLIPPTERVNFWAIRDQYKLQG